MLVTADQRLVVAGPRSGRQYTALWSSGDSTVGHTCNLLEGQIVSVLATHTQIHTHDCVRVC